MQSLRAQAAESVTVKDVHSKLDANGFWKATVWTTVKASKKIQIRYHYRDGNAWLHSNDLNGYISKLAIAKMTTYEFWHRIDEIGYVYVEASCNRRSKISRRHRVSYPRLRRT
jgi:hypothetical protein